MRKKKKKGGEVQASVCNLLELQANMSCGVKLQVSNQLLPPGYTRPPSNNKHNKEKWSYRKNLTGMGFFSLNWSGCDGPLTLSFFLPVDTISFLRRFENENIKVNLLSRPSPRDETLASCTSTHIATCRWLYTILTFLQNKSYHVYVTYLRQDFH